MTCLTCGSKFRVPPRTVRRGGGKFCAMACYAIHQQNTPHGGNGANARPALRRTCVKCGKSFKCPAGRPREHCSRACASRTVDLTCERCSTIFRVPLSRADARHCSMDCKFPDVRNLPCKRCGVVFDTRQGRLSFCSEDCRRPPLIKSCLTCNRDFRSTPADNQRFCSFRCYRRHTGETEPEGNVRRCLEVLGHKYAQEAVVANWRYSVDFLLPALDLIIEVDGSYWHSRTKDRDARKDAHMSAAGYQVIRLPDDPFYGDVTDLMVEAVRSAIAEAKGDVALPDRGGLYPLQLALPLH